ncbi:EthD family reductase [Cupriavidus plantarum]|uniref:EthD family reductase n=1 Tax=Cupriavidus plantarum TaxID=942865 RepID=UPI000E234A45|nr:EthD family reductase [Cupriavidus plantarum]REF01441.1 uncharacterized protein (TIGR02118 family) [Cupriavidus plantarum]
MAIQEIPTVVYVTYQGDADAWFDREYYVTGHLPLVMKAWKQYGLLSASAFFPAEHRAGTVAICECVFRDDDAVDAAFASAELTEVMADLVRFTHLQPVRVRATLL